MNKIRFASLIIGIGIIGLLLVNFASAQERTGIGISPLTFELTANPGDVLTNQLKVSNTGGSTIGVIMQIEDFTVMGEIGHVKIEPAETETYSIARWVETEPKDFVLEPGEWKLVTFTIKVPENAEPGGHYGSILASTGAVMGEEITGTAIAQRVGALVLLSVSGEVEEKIVVKEFSAPQYSEYGPIPFTIRFENTGTVHVKPTGFVTITNWMGQKIADVEFPQRNVIPGSVRKIQAELNQKWLWGGKYTATLTGSYGTNNIPLSPVVITFWAFPWKVGIVILVVMILLVLSRRRWIAAFRVLIKGEKT